MGLGSIHGERGTRERGQRAALTNLSPMEVPPGRRRQSGRSNGEGGERKKEKEREKQRQREGEKEKEEEEEEEGKREGW